MRAGKLDRRIEIQRFTATRDALGGEVKTWVTWKVVWAQYRPNRGSERFSGGQVFASNPVTFHIRHLPGLSVEDRVVYEGNVYDIKDVREIGRRVVTEFDCEARAV